MTSVEVTRADEEDLERWDGWVDRSPQGTLFHQIDVLRLLAETADATLYPLVGRKGQEPVGLFPVFEVRKGPVGTAFSPPPSHGVPYLGPALLNYRKLKQRKFEKLNSRFVEGVLEFVDENLSPKFTHLVTEPRYDDPRPFKWNEFKVNPIYTYEVDLSRGVNGLLDEFSRDARKNIRNSDEEAYEVREGGPEAIDYVLSRVNARYEEEDGGLHLDPEYVKRLYRLLPEGQLRPYVVTVDGVKVSGRITLHYGDTVTLWQGSPKPDRDVRVPVNDLLNWHSMVVGAEEGMDRCDVVGANTRRLCRYKSKFNPMIREYYELERSSRTMSAISGLYRRFA